MQKKSWIILAFCVALAGSLVAAYFVSQSVPEPLTEQQVTHKLDEMADAVARKDSNRILKYISPESDEKYAGLNLEQLRLMLARAFHSSSGNWKARYTHLVFQPGDDDAKADFDLDVAEEGANWSAGDYHGHITLYLRRVKVPRLFGLIQSKEWRIVKADSTGPDLSNFGE